MADVDVKALRAKYTEACALEPWGEVTPLLSRSFSGGISRLLKGQPGPQDVDGRVDVGVGLVAALDALEHGLGDAVLCRDVPAGNTRAPLRGVARVD